MLTKNYKKNINIHYAFSFFKFLDCTQGIWMIYLAYRGLSLTELGILEGFFHLVSFTMEVPTGIIADLYGRKVSRLIGRICSVISTLLMIFSSSFIGYLFAFAITALSYNLESGSGEALVYDSLKLDGKSDEYMKVVGKEEVIYQVSAILAKLIGGYLATIAYKWAFYMTLVMGLISFVIGLFFEEPVISEKKAEIKSPFKSMKEQLEKSIQVIKNKPKIAAFIVLVEYISTMNACFHYYLQNYWKLKGLSELDMGIIFAVSGGVGAIVAMHTHKLEKKIGDKKLIALCSAVILIMALFIGWNSWTIVGYVGIMVFESALFIATSTYIQELIPSEQRASIISLQSMAFSFMMIIAFPLVGKIAEIYSLEISFKLISTVGAAGILFNYWILYGNKRK
ncbi:MAG: MFS transporter [Tissierellales bacterium]|jgi:MFS family permease|nr:MFS transporter [Tissierellales bacterium]